jgi:hypothetical protein
MNENGYQYKRTFPFEIYHNNFKEHPQKKCIVDFCIPILAVATAVFVAVIKLIAIVENQARE